MNFPFLTIDMRINPSDLNPTDKEEPKWFVYQRLVARLQEAPECEVIHNFKTIGKSGVERQVDVLLYTASPENDILRVAIECKCFEKNPVSIKEVEAFFGFLDDVGANRGVIISNSGFTQGAKKRAEGSNIALETLTIEEAEQFDRIKYMGSECHASVGWCCGHINWYFEEDRGSEAGYCTGCGMLHVKCADCCEVGTCDSDEYLCECCGTQYGFSQYREEITEFFRVDPDQDDSVS